MKSNEIPIIVDDKMQGELISQVLKLIIPSFQHTLLNCSNVVSVISHSRKILRLIQVPNSVADLLYPGAAVRWGVWSASSTWQVTSLSVAGTVHGKASYGTGVHTHHMT